MYRGVCVYIYIYIYTYIVLIVLFISYEVPKVKNKFIFGFGIPSKDKFKAVTNLFFCVFKVTKKKSLWVDFYCFNFYQFKGMGERVAVFSEIANCLFKVNNKGFKLYPREAFSVL